MSTEKDILWRPSESFQAGSQLRDYESWLERNYGLKFDDYEALWAWSVEEVALFWESLWMYFGIIQHAPYKAVLSSYAMPGAEWFDGAELNYSEHIFRHKTSERPALLFANEKENRALSWTELEAQVKSVRAFLVEKGIGKGDTVAGYLPNIPEAMICFMAVNSLGAIWSCCSPDFGTSTVIERFAQIEPKVFIAVDGYSYGGKEFSRLKEVVAIREGLGSLRETLFIPYLDKSSSLDQSTPWAEVIGAEVDGPLQFEPVPFAHPIWVLYSSGTTGRPKAITHSHGGVLMEHLKYHAFHNDTKAGEHYFWFSTTGWMMWNFLQASMLVGAVPVLYDGNPGYPDMTTLWKLVEDLPIHHFGASAPYLTACMKKSVPIGSGHDLSALRSVSSTGAPLPPEVFQWIYENVKQDLWLCSMSGGTDVCTAFVGGVPSKPVLKGKIQGRALGCALRGYDVSGQPITGSLGEMVIEKPMPSMPVFFWGDEGGLRYQKSYFDQYPGLWRHGDWIDLDADGQLVIHGRSDATLNRKGIRIGTAEIYNVIDQISEVKDALVLNLEKENGDDFMPLFVVMAEGETLTDDIEAKVKSELKAQCSFRHVPDRIIAVADIPYTLSGKKMEVPVKKIFKGMDLSQSMNKDAIRNPEAIDGFVSLAEKLSW